MGWGVKRAAHQCRMRTDVMPLRSFYIPFHLLPEAVAEVVVFCVVYLSAFLTVQLSWFQL